MLAFFDPEQFKHEPKFSLFSGVPKPNSEVAERAKVLREALQQHGHELKEPEPHGLIPVEAVHHHIAHREVDHHVKHRCRSTLIGCRTERPEPCSIWCRQLVPQAAMCSLDLA